MPWIEARMSTIVQKSYNEKEEFVGATQNTNSLFKTLLLFGFIMIMMHFIVYTFADFAQVNEGHWNR